MEPAEKRRDILGLAGRPFLNLLDTISGAAATAVMVLSPVLSLPNPARGPNLLGPQTRGAVHNPTRVVKSRGSRVARTAALLELMGQI